ncbi:choline transporter [Myriangium duriaei CBS 260.36]|uniref:Choline transporter n=1 Tax=Myriangium duriaei CBS 260.36 TaxID=1168546 RepID=A0A9P4IXI3_9PEZI|nr:choline transporter [Myriangium duriaei CBS 260.36]
MAGKYEKNAPAQSVTVPPSASDDPQLNASGHAQEVDRSLGFFHICAVSIAVDGAWLAGSGALLTALYNGGGPGVLYGLLFACVFYAVMAACISELASAMPTSASVYHWASVTAGPRWGRVCSFYAGWWNMLAWMTATSGAGLIYANTIMAIYTLYHPGFEPQRWQIFIIYLIFILMCAAIVAYGQKWLPHITTIAVVACMGGWIICLLVVAIMPARNGYGYAPHSFVWKDWQNLTGWNSNGFVFLAGTLNGAWTIGVVDVASHLAEEVPNPKRNIPLATFIYLIIDTITAFVFYVALLYCITDLDAIRSSPITSLPLVAIVQQATRTQSGTAALLILFLFAGTFAIVGCVLTATRILWTLGRDHAVPFSGWVGLTSPHHKNPFNATIITTIVISACGLIYVVNAAAFSAVIGCFVILSTASYLAAILPHLLTRRRYVRPGPFWMPSSIAYPLMWIASIYIVLFDLIYMFPFIQPTAASSMNYASVICGGSTLLITPWYFYKRHHGYKGPIVLMHAADNIQTGHVLMGAALRKDRQGVAAQEAQARGR